MAQPFDGALSGRCGKPKQARVSIGRWVTVFNHQRPYTLRREDRPMDCFLIRLKHGAQPPAVVYFNGIETDQQVQAVD